MKPISAERRVEFQQLVTSLRRVGRPQHTTLDTHLLSVWVEELLDAEGFWRAQIASMDPVVYNYENRNRCNFCGVADINQSDVSHAPDCPWVLAQSAPQPNPPQNIADAG